MATPSQLQTQSSLSAALPGTWKLAAGRAITLQPREDGVLRVAHGRLWATFDGPHGGPLNDLGDHVIDAGGRLGLRAGRRVVVEAWDQSAPAYFSWDPLTVSAARTLPRAARVRQPLSDLGLALTMAGGAMSRLLAGLGSLAWETVAGPGRRPLAARAAPCEG